MTETVPIDAVVDGYFAMWNETDTTRRGDAIAAAWTPGGAYVDPLLPVDAHHDRARWDWELASPDGGTTVVSGVDFAVLAPDGRLREVTGFFARPTGEGA